MPILTAFVSATPLPTLRRQYHLALSSRAPFFITTALPSPKWNFNPLKTVLPHVMRHNRFTSRFSRSSSRRSPFSWPRHSPSFLNHNLLRAESLWSKSTRSERSVVIFAAVGAIALAGLALNVVFHISVALVFAIVPLIFAPILFLVMAVFSLFALITFSAAGAGFFFVGTPFVAVMMLAKALFPVAALAASGMYVMERVFAGWKNRKVVQTEDIETERGDMDYFGAKRAEEEAFERFDEKLGYRTTRAPRSDVMAWGLSDVVDELDNRGLGEYRQLFIEERIDGSTLLALTNDDIKMEFGHCMPLGDRLKLSKLVNELRGQSSRSRLL